MPTVPKLPANVAAALAAFPKPAERKLLQVRALIYKTAAANPLIGQLEETLKWGQPAYLPRQPRVGTTVRLGWSDKRPESVMMFVHCQTTLVDTYRAKLGNAPGENLQFEGDRALVMAHQRALPKAALALCIEAALTYHLKEG